MIGRRPLESVKSFAAVGFDLDHTLLRYRMRNFIRLINESASTYLVSQKGYSDKIFAADEEELKQRLRIFFRAIFDHRTGNLLKIDSNCSVMRAYKGFRMLSREELVRDYGSFMRIDPRALDNFRGKDWTYLHDFYGAGVVPLLAQICQLKNEGKDPLLAAKSYREIVKDIFDGAHWNYTIKNPAAFDRNEFHGFWYPKMMSEPMSYVNPLSAALRQRLVDIRASGRRLFIVSNNYFSPSNMVLKSAFGSDWLELFDFVIFEADKPHFFYSPRPGNDRFKTLSGESVGSLERHLSGQVTGTDKVLIGGNASHISSYFDKVIGEGYQVCFFGDSIYSDCAYSFNSTINPNWVTCLILEELQELERGYPDKEYYNYCSYWGSALHDKSIISGVDKTYIFHVADKVAHRSFSALESPEALEFLKV